MTTWKELLAGNTVSTPRLPIVYVDGAGPFYESRRLRRNAENFGRRRGAGWTRKMRKGRGGA